MTATALALRVDGAPPTVADGRRRRARASRARIVEAMMALVQAGEVAPSPAQVAAAAGVGLRTVFRHFEDTEGLHREVSDRVYARLQPILARPFAAADWRGRLDELAARRAEVFEQILPFKVAADLRRRQSPFIAENWRRQRSLERGLLEAVLPEPIRADPERLEALDLALGFDAWRTLRQEQGLTPEAAAAVTLRLVAALVA